MLEANLNKIRAINADLNHIAEIASCVRRSTVARGFWLIEIQTIRPARQESAETSSGDVAFSVSAAGVD
jgi:hypothetical protein